MSTVVSVVIPCFNGGRYLAETVQSVLDQDFEQLEVLVVDDGSTDETPEVISQLKRTDSRLRSIRIINSGVAVARNSGYARIAPESNYVLFLDSDDVLIRGALSRLLDRLEEDPSIVAAFGTCSRMNADGVQTATASSRPIVEHVGEDGVRRIEAGSFLGYWDFAAITPISTPGQCLLRRDVLGAEPPFDPSCVPCEDWDLWLRIARRGPVGVVSGEVLRYRDRPTSASKRFRVMQERRRTVLLKQLETLAAEEVPRFRIAWRYGLYAFDAGLCIRWAAERLRRRDLSGALRYAIRSVRYVTRLGWATLVGEPLPRRDAEEATRS